MPGYSDIGVPHTGPFLNFVCEVYMMTERSTFAEQDVSGTAQRTWIEDQVPVRLVGRKCLERRTNACV